MVVSKYLAVVFVLLRLSQTGRTNSWRFWGLGGPWTIWKWEFSLPFGTWGTLVDVIGWSYRFCFVAVIADRN